VNNYELPMRNNPLPVACLALFLSTPLLFAQAKPTSPRLAESLSAVELVANSSLNPANEEASKQFDETFSKPIQINDGRKRSYVLAVDELYQPTPDGVGQIIPIKESSKPSTLASVANILALEKKQETRLILYPVGAPHNDQTRRILSRDVLVKTDNREAAIQAATDAGLRLKSEPAYAQGFLVFTSDTPAQVVSAVVDLQRSGNPTATPLLFISGDGLFLPDDPLFKDEWHIRGRGQNGAKKASDARITPVWEQRDSSGNLIRGTGITIGIVEDGVQMDHPDLVANISSTYFFNWGSGAASDPNPQTAANNHGTPVAGVAAASGYNGIGVTGVAPQAKIAPLRFWSDPFTDSDEAELYAYGSSGIRVKNNSWGVGNRTTALTTLGTLAKSSIANAAQGGQIILYAAGNGLQEGEDVNFRERQNSIYVLSVAASNDQGRQTDYSTPGSAVLITGPAGGDIFNFSSSRPQGTSTADRTGTDGYNIGGVNIYGNTDYVNADYTENFNGTSSACPVVSGVTALVLQANSSLNWRDVKEIYIRSATKNDSGDSDWARNGSGFWFNHKYGAGLINASDAVRLAKNWSNLGTMTSVSIPLSSIPATIRDNNSSGLVKYFDTRSLSGLRVEHATVTTDISHPSRGELEIQLTSPDGTTSRLAEKHTSYAADPADYPDWTFSTVHNWGEDSRGLWKLKIADRVSGNTGTLNSATLTLYGTAK
jgi:subtilisin-like proprotein convertase family protein